MVELQFDCFNDIDDGVAGGADVDEQVIVEPAQLVDRVGPLPAPDQKVPESIQHACLP